MLKTKSKLNIGIISSQEQFSYIQNKINKYLSKITSKNKTDLFKNKKLNIHYINNNIIPNNLDYIVVGCLHNDELLEQYLVKSFKWIESNRQATLIISCPNKEDSAQFKTPNGPVKYYLPINILTEIENRVNNKHINYQVNDLSTNYKNCIYKISNKQIINGKPYIYQIDNILEHYNIKLNQDGKNDHILVVGDNLNTDIKLAKVLNCDSCLVMSGVTNYEDIVNINNTYSGREFIKSINYIVPDISYLLYSKK